MLSTQQSVALLKKGIHFWNQWRVNNPTTKPDLTHVHLVGANLAGANFRELDLRQANLSRANLTGACLSWADLAGANLSGDHLQDADLTGANLSKDNLIEADLSRDNLRQANLSGADLRGANLIAAYLRGSDLTGANLSGANLRRANLQDADLSDACLEFANLIEADCHRANFTHANFSGAKLKGADLRLVRAIATNFNEAHLTGACIENWIIDDTTKLDRAVCDYIFLRPNQRERRPRDQTLLFGTGEFAQWIQSFQNQIDWYFPEGIDWQAFCLTLQTLQKADNFTLHDSSTRLTDADPTNFSQSNPTLLSIQAIEQYSDGSLRVRLLVPPHTDRAEVERQAKHLYQTQLESIKTAYQRDLQATPDQITHYHQESADLKKIVHLLSHHTLEQATHPNI